MIHRYFTVASGNIGHGEAQETVRAHFQQDAGEDDGTCGGSFGVRVGQPGVEREHGDFDGEGEKESPEQPFLQPSVLRCERVRQDLSDVEMCSR